MPRTTHMILAAGLAGAIAASFVTHAVSTPATAAPAWSGADVKVGTVDVLLLLEHPPTVTLGRNGKWHHLLVSEETLRNRGVRRFETDRGGDITYHGPGQLVGYPLMKLNIDDLVDKHQLSGEAIPKADYLGYLRKLEQVLINSLHSFGILAGRQTPDHSSLSRTRNRIDLETHQAVSSGCSSG